MPEIRPAFRALGEVALSASAPAAVVAWRAGAALTRTHFEAEVAAWRAAFAAAGGTRWALHADDAFDFAAALFGAWHAGKVVVLPGDAQPATLARLRACTDGLAGDLPGALARAPLADGLHPLRPLDLDATSLVIHTSGTSGEPLAIGKRLAQLDAEVHALEARFGALCDSGRLPANLAPDATASHLRLPDIGHEDGPPAIWGTVSHQHIYGLLFRVLWPLAAARPIVCERLVYPEDIAARLGAPGGAAASDPGARGAPALPPNIPAVLVTSPAHLRRLPAHLDWSGARAALRAVFSSGGPLPVEAAEATRELVGAAPVEVYGSSETGGVAWRQRARHGDTWQPLPGVHFRIEEDGALGVQSAHLPDAAWWRTADRAAPAGVGMDGFELLGRADRVVKIEEKRVSLTALEQLLRETGDIAEARVLVLAPAGAGAAGGVVAGRPVVVAVPSAAGRTRLQAGGKRALVARLRAALATAVEPVALPRRWRFVDALPVDAQGKPTQALLAALFRPVRPVPAWSDPDAGTGAGTGAERARAQFELDPALQVFEGHFPGRPILPGVAQVDWAIGWARERFALPARFLRVDVLKFQQPLEPGMRVELELHWNAAAGVLKFEYRCAQGRHASGNVVFAVEEGAAGAA
jgi:acyl-coenzyme A synthetase/AMP-(fatty) acid ligase/3-hydroxymyristoyl/3-hydroxydecanoyl-(acyl carrier protein) dehydratase